MWAFAIRFPRAHLNEMIMPWRVQGPLDVGALRHAVDDVVQRHPALRSRLAYEHGQLLQTVDPHTSFELPLENVDAGSTDDNLAAAMEAVRGGDPRPIDVINGPTTVGRLYRIGDQDHVLCLRVHHAMCDGWSIGVLLDDLLASYEARVAGRQADLPPIAQQMWDVARWEIDSYEGGGFASEIEFWQTELAGLPPPLALPALRSRKGLRDWGAQVEVVERPRPVLELLRNVARTLRVSPFAVLLAALTVVLRHRTGTEDQLLGVPTLNRWSDDALRYVGYATSLMPVRVRLSGADRFDGLCRQANASTRKMLAYGRVPLEVLLRETELSSQGNSVFPVWCQYIEGAWSATVARAGLRVSGLATERHTMLAELDLDIFGEEDRLLCEFGYRSALFADQSMKRVLADFLGVLRAGMERPTSSVSELAALLS